MKRLFQILIIVGIVFIFNESFAQVPRLVHYQGLLKNGDGSPFNGTTNLYFKIYKSAQSETPLWSETHSNIDISNGLFEVLLGSQNPLNLSFHEYYLEVGTNVDEAVGPRIEIVGSGYNFRLNFLFAAYTIVWLSIFLYLLSISRRQKKLISELEVLTKAKVE